MNLKINHLNLIRLIAATQVLVLHAQNHLNKGDPTLTAEIVKALPPGVPVFFLISGFLIYWSYENCGSFKIYAQNRSLRIFPGLWSVTILGILTAALIGQVDFLGHLKQATIWLFAQATMFQFYNPEFLREYGCGTLNGSLWTISVELQFYAIVPVLYFFEKKIGVKALVLATMASLVLQMVLGHMKLEAGNPLWLKLAYVSAGPFFWMFGLGALAHRFSHIIVPFAKQYVWLLVAFYFTAQFFLKNYMEFGTNNPNPICFAMLSLMILGLAYTKPGIFNAFKRFDISYGIYVYHMIIVNIMLHIQCSFPLSFWLTLLITTACATLSWFVIEKPMLRFKRRTLHAVKS